MAPLWGGFKQIHALRAWILLNLLAVEPSAEHTFAVCAEGAGGGVKKLEGSLGALDVHMTDELYREIAELSPAPAPATDRTEARMKG